MQHPELFLEVAGARCSFTRITGLLAGSGVRTDVGLAGAVRLRSELCLSCGQQGFELLLELTLPYFASSLLKTCSVRKSNFIELRTSCCLCADAWLKLRVKIHASSFLMCFLFLQAWMTEEVPPTALTDVNLRLLCHDDIDTVKQLCGDWFPIEYVTGLGCEMMGIWKQMVWTCTGPVQSWHQRLCSHLDCC